jgi:hypothetical protein
MPKGLSLTTLPKGGPICKRVQTHAFHSEMRGYSEDSRTKRVVEGSRPRDLHQPYAPVHAGDTGTGGVPCFSCERAKRYPQVALLFLLVDDLASHIVIATSADSSLGVGSDKTSCVSTTKSASLPGAEEPFSASSKAA